MARRRAAPRRRRSSSGRSIIRRARGMARGGGGFGPVIQGVIAGIASQVGQKFLPGYGGPLGVGAAGYFTGNQTLLTLAGMQASALLPLGNVLGGSSNAQVTGGYL